MEASRRLRQMMSKGMVVAPFCLNAYHAKIAQLVGFETVYMTGWGTAAERGFPDVGLVTQTEMVQNARYTRRKVANMTGNSCSQLRVSFDCLPFPVIQLVRLIKYLVTNTNLADIM